MKNLSVFILFILGFIEFTMSQSQFLNIGHRGAMGYELENTRASFLKAIEMKVDMIELDVFQCASGELVVFHDDNMSRLTNCKADIEALTFDSIQKVSLLNGEKIPLLSEIIDLINGRVDLNIELKGKNTAQKTLELIEAAITKGSWRKEQFVISSFNWDELNIARSLDTTIQIAVLTEENPMNALSVAQTLNAISINPWFHRLRKSQVAKMHESGFKVFTYTVNEPKKIERMKDIGVDGVFCNFPDRVNH